MPSSIEYRILNHAQQVFMKYGVRNITMDDLARELGISKKTIYQYYSNKADLVFESARAHIGKEEAQCSIVAQSAENAIDEMVKVATWSFETFRTMSPTLIYEVQKYYPKAWALFQDFRDHFVLREVRKNLHRGIEEGLYRQDLNVEIIARMRISQIDISAKQEFFPINEFPQLEIQFQLFDMFLRGIVSEKGRQLLSKYLASGSAKSSQATTPLSPSPTMKPTKKI